MNKKAGPYVFLGVLMLILIFILGTRYGQQIEKTNKKNSAVLSIAPTKPPLPTTLPLEFKTFTHKGCGISFLYPNFLKIEKETSTSADLIKNKSNRISINCMTELSSSSREAVIKKTNLKNYKTIWISGTKSLINIVNKTLEFSP